MTSYTLFEKLLIKLWLIILLMSSPYLTHFLQLGFLFHTRTNLLSLHCIFDHLPLLINCMIFSFTNNTFKINTLICLLQLLLWLLLNPLHNLQVHPNLLTSITFMVKIKMGLVMVIVVHLLFADNPHVKPLYSQLLLVFFLKVLVRFVINKGFSLMFVDNEEILPTQQIQ